MSTELDDEYLPSRRVANVEAYVARYRAGSDRARATLPFEPNLAYGSSAAERLDLFSGPPGSPVVVFFHGGYWRAFSKDDNAFVALGLVPRGLTVATIDYALAPHVTLEVIVAQARRAVAWVAAQPRFAGVPIVVAGHSAGGHLAAMCAVTQPVTGVVTISGLHDVRPLVRTSVNDALHLDVTQAATLSPALLAPAAPTRVYATAGERESESFHAQATWLTDAWSELGCTVEYRSSPGDDHFSIVEQLADRESALVAACVRLAA